MKVKCPFCENETEVKKKYVECDMCGNGFNAKQNEVDKQ